MKWITYSLYNPWYLYIIKQNDIWLECLERTAVSSSSFCSVWKGQMHTGNKGFFVPKRESLSLPQPLSPITVSVLIFVGWLFSSPLLPSLCTQTHAQTPALGKLLHYRDLMPFITEEYESGFHVLKEVEKRGKKKIQSWGRF